MSIVSDADPTPDTAGETSAAFVRRLNAIYLGYTASFIAFVLALAGLEQIGMPKRWIGVSFLLSTVALYAGIGIISRTTDAAEYYVAGRRVPAFYNGMATAADWMSAASFIGLAGTLYLQGYAGLAFITGWTGGYCLVAVLIAPYLRKFGQYTIPDFLGARYGGQLPRLIAIIAAILCSFLGGMRAVTWTQVAQYIVLIIAFMVPVVWLSVKQTGVALPQFVYGSQLKKISEREKQLVNDPKEIEVIALFKARAQVYAAKLKNVPQSLAQDRVAAEKRVTQLKAADAPLGEIQAAEKAFAAIPKNEASAREAWTYAAADNEARARPLAGMLPHSQQFGDDPLARRNFLALVFCLMVGTAGLPHLLVRCYTTPSVKQARESVAWSLLFIFLLYVTAPALAVLVKFEVFNVLVGTPFDQLPAWISNWSKVDPSLLSVVDINRDGILQLGEMKIGGDIVVLATPEIAGLPYVVSGMVAAGGLAAALSTADGLLLTIANALSHDLYYKMIDTDASSAQRVTISKVTLLAVALAAAAVAAQKPVDILFLVSAAFSLAAAAFFPAMVLGVFWARANRWGAVAGMGTGLGVTVYYLVRNEPWLRGVFGVESPVELWWGIQPISAGVFGVVAGFALMAVVSLLTPAPRAAERAMVDHIRYPNASGL